MTDFPTERDIARQKRGSPHYLATSSCAAPLAAN